MDGAKIAVTENTGTEIAGSEIAVTERLLERLRRIRELEGAAPELLLGELRRLVVDAEEWARLEGDERARLAVEHLDEALSAIEEVRPKAVTLR